MAAFAPMPSARVRTTVTVSPFARESERIANFRSCRKFKAISFPFMQTPCRSLLYYQIPDVGQDGILDGILPPILIGESYIADFQSAAGYQPALHLVERAVPNS